MLHSGFLLQPLQNIAVAPPNIAKKLVSCPLQNLSFLIYHGTADDHFAVEDTINDFKGLFDNLGIPSALKEIDI